MKSTLYRSQVWFKLSVVAGILLGLSLFIQSVTTYFYVSGRLLREEAEREAGRKVAALERVGHLGGVADEKRLQAAVQEVRGESPAQIAWIRVITLDGQTLAETGDVRIATVNSPALLRKYLEAHDFPTEVRDSPRGKVLIATFPLHWGRPPHLPLSPPPESRGASARPAPSRLPLAEIGLYLKAVSVPFGDLRRHVALGCSAAFVLVLSMGLMAVLFERYQRSKAFERELELAERVQRDLLPSPESASASVNPTEFAAISKPASQVGGDFYDVFTGPEGQICLAIGDVSGKGLSAALLMGVIHGVIRAADWVTAPGQHETATENLNRLLCEKTARERFASLFWASFDSKKGWLRYVNAGHLPPLLVHYDSAHEPAQRLEGGGPVLGLLPGTHYGSCQVTIKPGDLLVAYSDGIAEATNEADEEFGEQRILELVRNNATRTPHQVCEELLAAIARFLGPLQPHDDQTLVVLRLLPVPSGSAYAGQVTRSTRDGCP